MREAKRAIDVRRPHATHRRTRPVHPPDAAVTSRQGPRVRLLDVDFDALTERACVEQVWAAIRDGRRGWLCTVNVAILMSLRADRELASFVDRSAWTVADGQPVVGLSRMLGTPLPERVAGVDLVELLCDRAAAEGVGVFLLGATTKHVEAAADGLRRRHRGLRVETADGYFPLDAGDERARQVANSGARLLFVGMGVPRQERFIERYWDELGATVVIGVGGTFDVLAGLRSRAPRWIQRYWLEWAYRLVQEPWRLWRRYLVTNTLFSVLALRELVGRARPGRGLSPTR